MPKILQQLSKIRRFKEEASKDVTAISPSITDPSHYLLSFNCTLNEVFLYGEKIGELARARSDDIIHC